MSATPDEAHGRHHDAHGATTPDGGDATEPDAATPGPDDRDTAVDPLVAVRAELEDVLELPLAQRAEVFEAAHRVVVAELRALELG